MKMYTVTAFSTHFVEAEDASKALSLVHEALLGNDPNRLLTNSEVNYLTMHVREGFHSTIKHGDE